jgi:hypothetical protein
VSDRFTDRLDPATYAADEPVGAGTSDDYSDWVYVPDRLFDRVQHLARAYDLHVLPSLHPHRRNELNHDRITSLIEELEFLVEVVNDPALVAAIAVIRDAALRVLRDPIRSKKFLIEGP